MCGIIGIYNLNHQPVENTLLRRMCNIISHRGPDDEGFYQNGPIGLGIRRLAIIDVAGGQQPISNEDGSIWIVFNGEIYNYLELRASLEQKGHHFKTQSDTETIVHLYEEQGIDCVCELRGMFAFALWDAKAQRLLLARDRLGIKPLFYAYNGQKLLFASEMKAILQDQNLDRQVDLSALKAYLAYLYVPAPKTILQGVNKLPPAHILVCENGQTTRQRYWQLQPESLAGYTEDEIVAALRQQLQEAVKIRLMSEVPLGAFLSGGVDSSAVVALMTAVMNRPVKTFSIGFENNKFNELQYARMVAEHCQTDHYEFVVRPDAVEILPKLVWQFDEPFADPSMLPTYYVTKMARQHVTVCLSGDGGDESFAGYRRYSYAQRTRIYDGIPRMIKQTLLSPLSNILPQRSVWGKRLRQSSLSAQDRYIENVSYLGESMQAQLLADDIQQSLGDSPPVSHYLQAIFDLTQEYNIPEQLLYVDIYSYLPEDILVKLDRTSMLNSLEARVPFLDHRLLEFVAGIPFGLKLKNGSGKYILKKALQELLPDKIFQRGKQGFSVPLGEWFGGTLYTFARDILMDHKFAARGLFNQAEVEQLLQQHRSGIADMSRAIYILIVFELWCQAYLDQR